MPTIGIHANVFAGEMDSTGLRVAAQGAKDAGFALLELPLLSIGPGVRGADARRVATDEFGLALSGSLGLDESSDISSTVEAYREAGGRVLRDAIDFLSDAGGTELCGVLQSCLGRYDHPATEENLDNSANMLRGLGEYAQDRGITLSLEVVNRYESNLFNTAQDARAFLQRVGHRNVRLHLDAYHMNIEEASMDGAIRESAGDLEYFHVGESNRGYLGSGSVDFDAAFRALGRIRFEGPVVFESFSRRIVSKALSNRLGVWRDTWTDPDDLARKAIAFMTAHIARAYS